MIEVKELWEQMDSHDIITNAVKAFWEKGYPRDVVAFFCQKYDFETDTKWEQCEEIVISASCSDYDSMTFLNDFCEGQTCVKDIVIVPLSEVTDYYARNKLKRTGY